MPRAANTNNARSQPRSTQPSRSQRPSQSQRRPRHAAEEEIDEAEEEDNDEETEDRVDGSQDEVTRKANALVRLALFNEYKRLPLRREDISKKVLGQSTRAFNTVFAMAQITLQKTFGMELVELTSRAVREKEQNDNDETRGNENATGLKKKTISAGSKSYILRSVLHPDIIETTAATDEQLLEDEILEVPDDEDDAEGLRSYGSIFSWSSADELGPIGILYVLLALVLVSGGVLSDMDLKKHLKSLRLSDNAVVNFSAQSTHKSISIDTYLQTLVRQGYLDKSRVGNAGAPRATQVKRGRNAGAGDDEGNGHEWKWGSRAQAEVGELAVGRFVGEFLVERMINSKKINADSDEEDEEVQQRNGKRKGTQAGEKKRRNNEDEDKDKLLEAMMKGITRAAGGKLNDVK